MTYRVVVAGAELRMLILASATTESIGIDLSTGGFVRAGHPATTEANKAFEVVAGEIAGSTEPPDDARPEALELTTPPRRIGRMSRRRATKRLTRLAHPRRVPLLGLTSDAVPYWTLAGDRPSVAIVELSQPPDICQEPTGLHCRFPWGPTDQLLPFTPEAETQLLAGIQRTRSGSFSRALGYRPTRLLVVLAPPVGGYCRKSVAALLP